jgi:hypothetical protein
LNKLKDNEENEKKLHEIIKEKDLRIGKLEMELKEIA